MGEQRHLDLSNKGLQKFDRNVIPSTTLPNDVISLDLDGNNLQRLDNLNVFFKLRELSVKDNQLIRMFNVAKFHNLVKLELSNNHILGVEGIKELRNLKLLNLSHNNIKVVEANKFQNCVALEHIDLSHNGVSVMPNFSHLKRLKTLHLHKNMINALKNADLFLPKSLETLSLAQNAITDLNEISLLSHLNNLTNFSICGNPCVQSTGDIVGFDYRPFVLNWCVNLKTIDGYAIDDIEKLKSEWLYSQGRGRWFKLGEHEALADYLAETCPLTGKMLESEKERKLKVVLNKAQQYKRQLSEKVCVTPSRPVSRMSTLSLPKGTAMTRSLDQSSLRGVIDYQEVNVDRMTRSVSSGTPPRKYNFCVDGDMKMNAELQGITKLLPAPDSIVSPLFDPSNSIFISKRTNDKSNTSYDLDNFAAASKYVGDYLNKSEDRLGNTPKRSDYDTSFTKQSHTAVAETKLSSERIRSDKLAQINAIAAERRKYSRSNSGSSGNSCLTVALDEESNNATLHEAATRIQKMWRGYHARTLDNRVASIYQQVQSLRFNQYIKKISEDIESVKNTLSRDHELQSLQMEAITQLWKKVSHLHQPPKHTQTATIPQGTEADKLAIAHLASTCSSLEKQVNELQQNMREILQCVSPSKRSLSRSEATATSTQTEIIAVHTPQQGQAKQFPYISPIRPTSLVFDDTTTKRCIENGTIARNGNG